MAEQPKRVREIPKPRKAFGTAANLDGDVLIYSEKEMNSFGDACFADGFRTATERARRALVQAGILTASNADGARIQAENDAWGDYNAGRGPRPTRR